MSTASIAHRLAFAVAAFGTLAFGAPASAQSAIAEDVAFFERVNVGDVEVTPFGVVRDRRCADIRFCTREDTLIISVILHDYRGMQEVVLELGEPVEVPGGFLVLLDAGTAPSLRSAIHLREYRLALEFIPLRFDLPR